MRKMKSRGLEILKLRQARAHEIGEIQRLEKRRAEITARKVNNEARRQRFVGRIDREIEKARQLLDEAEGKLLAMGEPIDDEMEVE